ncbi:MAG: C69 family dipeptidase, partial [Lachnospiraceae bacterium]|nr:C69 family dipeptidase [Lachnospiraceae bacterium]
CSPQLFSLPKVYDFAVYDENKDIDLILTYNEDNRYSDEAHLRVWVGHDVFAASEELDYDEGEGYDVFFAPDDDVTIAKAFGFFRNRYEGTPFDLNDNDNSYYWGISNQTVSNAAIVQIFGDVPAPMSTVIWDTPANPAASPFIPVIAYADTIPACFTTDIADAGSADGTLQYDFIRLADKAFFRRNSYGRSIKEYWEGMEAVSAAYVADAMEGRWKETYDESPAKAATELDDYMYKIVSESQENCDRITDELDWFMFRNGVVRSDIPDDQAATFECSFDAVSYAHANGWETTVEDDTFTATKDGKTIEVVLSGENEGNVTFKGFDNKKLMEDFMTDDTVDEGETDSDDSIPEGETVEEAEEKIEEAVEENREEEKAKEEKAEDKKAEDKKAETPAEEPAGEAAAEPASEETKEETADTGVEKAAQDVAAKLEVDTIAELESYFAEKIAGVPRDGWAEAEIAGQLGGVADDVSAIILKHFSVDDIDDLLTMDYAKIGNDIASDPAIADAADRLANAGIDLAGLTEKYFLSLSDEVAADVVSGRLSQDGAVRILDEAATDIEGIAKLYIEGVEGAFSDVFGNITEEDLKEFLSEVDDAADVLDEYGVIDQKSLGLDQIELEDLTDADVNVVITLNEMDQDVIDGLSDMLGVDVGSIVNGYMDELSKAGRIDAAGNQIVVEESHEASTAQSAPDEEVMTAIEVEEALSED